MTYDLTSLLTTIAASSASFVAILGGFIASKLITINGEREAVLAKISEIEQQRSFKQSEFDRLRNDELESLALGFIRSNIEALICQKDLDTVYRSDLQYDISIEDLTPYWNRAKNLVDELLEALNSCEAGEKLNENDLPKAFAQKYRQDGFAYETGEKIMKYYIKQSTKRNQSSILNVGLDLDMDDYIVSSPVQSAIDRNRMESLRSEVAWLGLQLQQLEDEKQRLTKPKGMGIGLIIFGAFSVLCIILPLVLCPLMVETIRAFRITKLIILLLFAVGLASVFGYLVYLVSTAQDAQTNRLPNHAA